MREVGILAFRDDRLPLVHNTLIGGLSMSNYIYTNWRGKQFVIDESFIDDMKKRISMDDGSDPNELAYLTPEILMEMIPTMEPIERYRQWEEMWDGLVNPRGR